LFELIEIRNFYIIRADLSELALIDILVLGKEFEFCIGGGDARMANRGAPLLWRRGNHPQLSWLLSLPSDADAVHVDGGFEDGKLELKFHKTKFAGTPLEIEVRIGGST
jgi:hypothetical protein